MLMRASVLHARSIVTDHHNAAFALLLRYVNDTMPSPVILSNTQSSYITTANTTYAMLIEGMSVVAAFATYAFSCAYALAADGLMFSLFMLCFSSLADTSPRYTVFRFSPHATAHAASTDTLFFFALLLSLDIYLMLAAAFSAYTLYHAAAKMAMPGVCLLMLITLRREPAKAR